MLNIIWIVFFFITFLTASFKGLILGDQQIFTELMTAMFSLSKAAFEIALGLTGVLSL
jgi:spore maturation protein SpmA